MRGVLGRRWGVIGLAVMTMSCGASGTPAAQRVQVTTTPAPEVTPELLVDFEEITAEFDSIVPRVTNVGTALVRTDVSTASGGRVRLARGAGADGAGARFPSHVDGAQAPAAVLLIWPDGDGLSPGKADFTFGASFRLDAVSDGGEADNGDNVVQRGLYVDEAQFKLQIDHGVPSCRVAGPGGEVLVSLKTPVEREVWYAARCERRGVEVHLQVRDLEGGRPTENVVEKGPTGDLTFEPGVPLAVGAKVLADGRIPTSATDQFNGVVDDVHFELLS